MHLPLTPLSEIEASTLDEKIAFAYPQSLVTRDFNCIIKSKLSLSKLTNASQLKVTLIFSSSSQVKLI